MKKLAFAVFVGIFCLGATNTFAQSKSERIAHLEGKVIALEAENAQNQRKLERMEHRADSLVGVNAELKVKLEMVNQQYAALQAQNERHKAIGDSLNRVNAVLQAQVIRAKAAAEKAAKAKAAEVARAKAEQAAKAKAEEMAKAQADEAAAKAKDQPKKAEAPKADERAVLQARIVSLERQAAATQAHEQARLINRDTDFVSNINKHIPWTVKYIRGSEIRSMYEDNGHYYVNVEFDRKLSYVWIYEFTISGDFIDRYMAPQHISGRKVNLNFARIVK